MLRCALFFFTDTATAEIYTLSLHDALPIYSSRTGVIVAPGGGYTHLAANHEGRQVANWLKDRKSTRLNSSHTVISYAVFCLKKKTQDTQQTLTSATDLTTTHADMENWSSGP